MSPPTTTPKILVLLSGSGSNFAALLAATHSGALPGTITHVISNRKSAYGLTRAHEASISTSYHNLTAYRPTPGAPADRAKYDADLAALILAQKPDLVVCAGWMHILSEACLTPLREAGVDIINLHPALPGCFDGVDAIRRAWEAGKTGEVGETGVMVHYVVAQAAAQAVEPVVVLAAARVAAQAVAPVAAPLPHWSPQLSWTPWAPP